MFEGRQGYIHSLCADCLPHHECPEFDEKRRLMDEEARRWLADQRRKKENPGQETLLGALDEKR